MMTTGIDDSQTNALGSHMRVKAYPGSLWGVSWDSCGSRNPRLPLKGMAGGSVTLLLMPLVQASWPLRLCGAPHGGVAPEVAGQSLGTLDVPLCALMTLQWF